MILLAKLLIISDADVSWIANLLTGCWVHFSDILGNYITHTILKFLIVSACITDTTFLHIYLLSFYHELTTWTE
jgi:hypothetical protein